LASAPVSASIASARSATASVSWKGMPVALIGGSVFGAAEAQENSSQQCGWIAECVCGCKHVDSTVGVVLVVATAGSGDGGMTGQRVAHKVTWVPTTESEAGGMDCCSVARVYQVLAWEG
jgi:hypothetical protein